MTEGREAVSDRMLKDLIDIATEVHRSDFVISLSDGIDEPERTIDSYVVTDQLLNCFDRALGLISSSVEDHTSKGAYLHGSFGSGKSHFMAVLHLLLQNNPHARSKEELQGVIDKYDGRLKDKDFLLVPYHMVGAESMEAGILGGYVKHVRKLHPEAPLPGVYLDQKVLQDARQLREQMGDEAFFNSLGNSGGDEGFGELAGGWDAERFEAALQAEPGDPERNALVSDYVDSFASSLQEMTSASGLGFVPFAEGLDAISKHANRLGYDGIVLFLDELVLWFASRMADPSFVNEEGQKVAKLVEAASENRPAPLVSFIARQRDLREFLGEGVPGAERLNFGEILQWWEGRFDVIELKDTNLRAIVEERLLEPKNEEAAEVLDQAFDELASDAGSALDTLMTSEADREAFRRVYPFSPAMIETLVAVSSFLQRERTALRLLLQLLVEKRDKLKVGDLVPLGDLYDVIRGGEEPFSDELKRHFVRAKELYQRRLRPMLLAEYDLQPEEVSSLPDDHQFHTDDRLIKTLLLAALVPTVDPLQGLTVRRLADLNHGTIKAPVPGQEKAAVLSRLRKWAPEIPELRLEGDDHDPVVSLELTGIDVDSILQQAAHVDNTGKRRAKIKELVYEALDVDDDNGLFAARRTYVWRGSRREVDVWFGNVRDETDIPTSEFRAQDRPRVMIDFPFDEQGRGPADDLARMQELKEEAEPTATIAWIPRFLTNKALKRLGRLVILDHILKGDRLENFTSHLSPQDRNQASHLLRNQAESLRNQMRDVLRQAYGIEEPDDQWVRSDLPLRDQFPTLDPTLDVRAPTAPTMNDAFEQLLDQVLSHLYPAHPKFEDRVRPSDLRTALEHVERAASARDRRVTIPKSDRKSVRKVMGPLKVATVGESHIVLDRHWRDHFHQKQEQNPGGTLTVERLEEWMDEPEPMGLKDEVANFVVASYVLMDNRVLVEAGQTIDPDIKDLKPTTEVRTQELPSEDDWEAAREPAEAIFGVGTASPIRNAQNVSNFVGSVREVASKHAEASRQLVDRLETAVSKMEMDEDTDRLPTARTARDVVDAVLSADEVEVVSELAGVEPPTSPAALGRSIKTAHEVVRAIDETHWNLFDSLRNLSGEAAEKGRQIRRRVQKVLQHDELSQSLPESLDAEEEKAANLLSRATTRSTPSPEPEPEPPGTGPDEEEEHQLEEVGSRSSLSGEQAIDVLQELWDRKDDLEQLSVSWTFRS